MFCFLMPSYDTCVLADDLVIGARLPAAAYRLVRYEDLVAKPEEMVRSLYKVSSLCEGNKKQFTR